MAPPPKKSDQQVAREEDQGDFSSVEDISQLEVNPSSVNQARVKDHQKALEPPGAVGFFEEGATDFGRYADGPMHLGAKTMADGGGRLAQYESGYNMYSLPLRSTVRAMGRVKDMSNAGAPMSPAELQADPKLKARFRQLSVTEKVDGPAQTAYGQWGERQTQLGIDVRSFQAGQMELTAANTNWDRIKLLLNEKRKESERAGKQSELNEINEAAETLAKIVEVSVEALTMAGELGEALEATSALDESAAETAMEVGEGEQAENARTLGARAADKAASAKSQAGDANAMLKRARDVAKTASGGKDLSLDLTNLFVVAMGNGGKKLELEKDIAKLSKQIENLKFKQVEADIAEGKQRLLGFKMDLAVRKSAVQADRQQARKGAQTFNQNLSGGDAVAGEMAMLSAEAHMELATMGRVASDERKQAVDPHWRWADAYLNDNHSRIDGFGESDSRKELAMNIFQVRDQRNYFKENLPKWEQHSHEWQTFLSHVGQSSFVAAPSKTDLKSGL